jgi:hypothetical protein
MPVDWIPLGETNANLPPTMHNYIQHQWLRMSDEQKAFTSAVRTLYKFAYDHTNPPTGNTYICNALDMLTLTPSGVGDQIVGRECGTDVFCGGHVIVQDSGRLYQRWVDEINHAGLAGARRDGTFSGSSHYRGQTRLQYEVHLPGLGCVLFGTVGAPNHHTWFQNESWEANRGGNLNPEGWVRTIAHGFLGFGFHYMTGRQVGAIGTSNYSEKPGAPAPALTLPDNLSI